MMNPYLKFYPDVQTDDDTPPQDIHYPRGFERFISNVISLSRAASADFPTTLKWFEAERVGKGDWL